MKGDSGQKESHRSSLLGQNLHGSLCFASLSAKNMAHHIFRSETELQNISEATPEASRSFSVSEKLARYDSSALSGVKHLTLLVGIYGSHAISATPL